MWLASLNYEKIKYTTQRPATEKPTNNVQTFTSYIPITPSASLKKQLLKTTTEETPNKVAISISTQTDPENCICKDLFQPQVSPINKQYPNITNVNTPPTSTNPSVIVTSTQAQTSASNKENLNFNNKRKTSANSSPLFDTTPKQQRLQFQCQTTTPQHKQTTLNFTSATQGLKTQYDNPTTTIDDLNILNPEFFEEN